MQQVDPSEVGVDPLPLERLSAAAEEGIGRGGIRGGPYSEASTYFASRCFQL